MNYTCKRWRKVGNNANACTEKRVRANTPTSVVKRDAKTTDADTAAFMDKTDVKLYPQISDGTWEDISIFTAHELAMYHSPRAGYLEETRRPKEPRWSLKMLRLSMSVVLAKAT